VIGLEATARRFKAWQRIREIRLGGLFQIVATNLPIMSFGYRNFAVETAYSRTETVQSAILACFVLTEHLRALARVGMSVGLLGVMMLSLVGRGMKPKELLAATVQPAALCGPGAGTVFAFTTVFIKLGNQSLSGPGLVVRAVYAGDRQRLANPDAKHLALLARTRGITQGVHHLAERHVGGYVVGLRFRLLVHRLRDRRGGSGARGRTGRDRVHSLIQPILFEGGAQAKRCRRPFPCGVRGAARNPGSLKTAQPGNAAFTLRTAS
jgi:multidrug transporter EmrE-like cation transporter